MIKIKSCGLGYFLFFKHYISVSNFNWKSRSNRVAYCIARDKSIKTFQMMHRLKKSNVWFRCYDFFQILNIRFEPEDNFVRSQIIALVMFFKALSDDVQIINN